MKVYDSDQVSVIFGGIPVQSGRADGTFCKITWDSPAFTDKATADGDVVRSKTNDNRATIELTLDQTSPTNAALSVLYNLDKRASNGAGVVPVLVRDKQGLSLHKGADAWISKSPDPEYAKDPTDRVWTIRVADLDSFDGGN